MTTGRALFMLAALMSACGDDTSAGDDTAASGVPCAGMTCPTPEQACCELPPPSSDLCYAIQGGVCEGGHPVRCDGSEDCVAGNVCCYSAGGSYCIEGPVCRAEGGRPMCHGTDVGACQAGEGCCPVGPAEAGYTACGADC